jgi:membrane-associated phospholipid phosphatase
MGQAIPRQKEGYLVAAFFLLIFLPALASGPLQAQESRTEISHFGERYLGRFFVDFKDVVVSPFHWRAKGWLTLGGTAAITGLLYAVDDDIADWSEEHKDTSSGPVPRFLSHLAEPPFLAGTLTALYLSGEIFHAPGLRRTILLCFEAYGANAVISSAMKLLVGRARYERGEGKGSFHPFSFDFSGRSFPSGHSGSVFCVAAIVAGRVNRPLVGALMYGAAGVVALSRLHDNEHWASDIFFGSALGYFIGKMILHLNQPSRDGGPTLGLGPAPGGFSLSLRF